MRDREHRGDSRRQREPKRYGHVLSLASRVCVIDCDTQLLCVVIALDELVCKLAADEVCGRFL